MKELSKLEAVEGRGPERVVEARQAPTAAQSKSEGRTMTPAELVELMKVLRRKECAPRNGFNKSQDVSEKQEVGGGDQADGRRETRGDNGVGRDMKVIESKKMSKNDEDENGSDDQENESDDSPYSSMKVLKEERAANRLSRLKSILKKEREVCPRWAVDDSASVDEREVVSVGDSLFVEWNEGPDEPVKRLEKLSCDQSETHIDDPELESPKPEVNVEEDEYTKEVEEKLFSLDEVEIRRRVEINRKAAEGPSLETMATYLEIPLETLRRTQSAAVEDNSCPEYWETWFSEPLESSEAARRANRDFRQPRADSISVSAAWFREDREAGEAAYEFEDQLDSRPSIERPPDLDWERLRRICELVADKLGVVERYWEAVSKWVPTYFEENSSRIWSKLCGRLRTPAKASNRQLRYVSRPVCFDCSSLYHEQAEAVGPVGGRSDDDRNCEDYVMIVRRERPQPAMNRRPGLAELVTVNLLDGFGVRADKRDSAGMDESEVVPGGRRVVSTVGSFEALSSGYIDCLPSQMLADTGATLGLVASSVLRRLGRSGEQLRPYEGLVRSSSGHMLRIRGWINVELRLGNIVVTKEVLVVDRLHVDAILDVDTLGAFGAVIDVGERTMMLKGTGEVLPLGVMMVHETFRASMSVPVRIPPRGQAPVMANLVGDAAEKAVVLVEGSVGLPPRLCSAFASESKTDNFSKYASASEVGETVATARGETTTVDLGEEVMAAKLDVPPDKESGMKADFHRLVSIAEGEVMEAEIQQYLELGLIRPSTSPWASPVLMIRKPDGGIRFCIDYRKLNAVTVKDYYPMPLIDDTLDVLSGAKLFSTMDIVSGYWNVPLHEDSVSKAAFTCKYGLNEWMVMPFGLFYLDDCVIFSKDFPSHLVRVRQVLTRFQRPGFKLKMKKCHWGRSHVAFLGHIATPSGILLNPEKVKAVMNVERPRAVHGIRSFLGLTSYFRRYIPGYALISALLERLKVKDAPFEWNEDCEGAFRQLKRALIKPPILAYPDMTKRFKWYVDSSRYAVGACLIQELARWAMELSSLDFKVLHKPGKSLGHVDGLSRLPMVNVCAIRMYDLLNPVERDHESSVDCGGIPLDAENLHGDLDGLGATEQGSETGERSGTDYRPVENSAEEDGSSGLHLSNVDLSGLDPDQFVAEQRKVSCIVALTAFLKDGALPLDPNLRSQVVKMAPKFVIAEYILRRRVNLPARVGPARSVTVPVIKPLSYIETVLHYCHADLLSSHLGLTKTLEKVKRHAYWPDWHRDVEEYVRECNKCGSGKGSRPWPAGRMQRMPLVDLTGPFSLLVVDAIGPLPETPRGYKYILVFVDYFTRWAEAFPVRGLDSVTFVDVMVNGVVLRHGVPSRLLSDNGSNFTSEIAKSFYQTLGIKKLFGGPYHPQTQGLVERFNGTLIGMLKMHVSEAQDDWDAYLPRYEISDPVWVYPVFRARRGELRTKKLAYAWHGSYRIVGKVNENTYKVDIPSHSNRTVTVNVNRLKPYRGKWTRPYMDEPPEGLEASFAGGDEGPLTEADLPVSSFAERLTLGGEDTVVIGLIRP
ncbi:unnamed protein product [Phytophthora fragariaefolia]|uniref:Unnamed protein product n=1 Tax=Phytophthora fragariaefolia TaxID=1490495 RepID=A0A9W6Y0I2_9STRA|nr:unnamed protein product [Phytophthora fragariaefolia]